LNDRVGIFHGGPVPNPVEADEWAGRKALANTRHDVAGGTQIEHAPRRSGALRRSFPTPLSSLALGVTPAVANVVDEPIAEALPVPVGDAAPELVQDAGGRWAMDGKVTSRDAVTVSSVTI